MTVMVWRAADHRKMRWKNGGGTSYEVACSPKDSTLTDFDWRISFAEVDAAGPFSTFPGVDRVIVLIGGERMVLTINGRRHVLERHQPLSFAGESTTSCELPAGPTQDLNIMTNRQRATAGVEVHTIAPAGSLTLDPTDSVVVIALSGRLVVSSARAEPITLASRDALWNRDGTPLTVAGPGTSAVVRFGRAS
jgi:environmental stress-induced protein Ves